MADSISVLVTTRYVKPGAYIGRIIRPAPTSQDFTRAPCIVGKGSRLSTNFNVPLRRSYREEVTLNFAQVAPHIAPLTSPSNNDKTVALLQKSNKTPLAASKWNFTESVPGSKVFDQVQITPTAFEPGVTYKLSYQSTSRTLVDDLPFTDLRSITRVADTQDQTQYIEGTDFKINSSTTEPVAVGTNGYTTSSFTTVTKVRGAIGTGTVTIATGSTYQHNYDRIYTLRCTGIAGTLYTFQWESLEVSGGNSMLPRVPIAAVSGSIPTFQINTVSGVPQTVALTHHLLGGNLGVSVSIDPTSIAVNDTWQFTAVGPGLVELDPTYSNTNQWPEIDTPVATLQPGSTGAVAIFDYTEFTGTINKTYVIEATSVSGVVGNRSAVFGWQGYGADGVTSGTITISEALGTNTGVTLESGVKVNFSFGASQFVVTPTSAGNVGDKFTIAARAAWRYPTAKDDRDYTVSVSIVNLPSNSSTTGQVALSGFYVGTTPEAGFNTFNVDAGNGQRTWALSMTQTMSSSMTADGTNVGTGTIAVSGTPTDSFQIVLQIVQTGSLGFGQFKISLDGGTTYGANTTMPASGQYTVTGTGISLLFGGSFVQNDLYRLLVQTSYPVPAAGNVTIPGDFLLWFRNVGANPSTLCLTQKRYVASPVDEFTFGSTDLLTIDWNLTSRVTETIDATQVFTDVIGTVTGVAGTKYIILTNLPDEILYVQNSPAGTALVYSQVAGTQYVSFPTAPAGNVAVKYQYRGPEPDPSNVYYITADTLRTTDLYNVPISILSRDELRQQVGPMAVDNDLLIGGEIAFDNNVPRLLVCQAYDTDFDGLYTTLDYNEAILATKTNSLLTDVIVLNNFASLSAALSNNEQCNDPFERKERVLWVGCPQGTIIGDSQTANTLVYLARNTLQVFGQNQSHGRRVLLGNTTATKSVVLPDGSQVTVDLDGSFVAVGAAALNASFSDPGETLLRKNIAGFDSIEAYNEVEELQLGAASILFLSDQGAGVFRFEESVTVDTSSINNREISAQNQEIFVTRDLRGRLDTATISFVPQSQQAGVSFIQSLLVVMLSEYVSRGIIAPYTDESGASRPIDPANDVAVFRDETDKTQYNFGYFYNLRYPIKRVFGVYSVDRKLFGVQ